MAIYIDYTKAINAEKAKGANANQYVLDKLYAADADQINSEAMAQYNAGKSNGSSGFSGAASQSDNITKLYEAKQQAALAGLKSAYEANTADLNNAGAQISNTYNTARNSAAGTSAQNQAAFNERAVASGLNSGAGSQASLAIGNNLASNLSTIDQKQADATNDIETQRQKLTTAYNAAIQQAVNDNDASKAQALYEEAVREDNKLATQAQLDLQKQQMQNAQNQYNDQLNQNKAAALASATGDYSLYKTFYGWTDQQVAAAEAANKKSTVITYSNPSSPITSYTSASANIDAWLKKGLTYGDISSNLNSMHNSGKITDEEYNNYSLILDSKAYDAGIYSRANS